MQLMPAITDSEMMFAACMTVAKCMIFVVNESNFFLSVFFCHTSSLQIQKLDIKEMQITILKKEKKVLCRRKKSNAICKCENQERLKLNDEDEEKSLEQ